MEEARLVEIIVNAVAGPASGIVVSMLCLFGFGWFMIKHMLPQQEKQLDKLLDESKEQRKTFEKSVTTMARRMDKMEDDVSEILKDVQHIKQKV